MSDIRALLVEVGGNEQNDIEILEVELDDVDIDQFLIQAAQKYDSQEATPGNTVLLSAIGPSQEPMQPDGQDDLAIDFHNDHFWSGLDIIQNGSTLSPNSTRSMKRSWNRVEGIGSYLRETELHLRNVNIHATIPAGGLVRIEGPHQKNKRTCDNENQHDRKL